MFGTFWINSIGVTYFFYINIYFVLLSFLKVTIVNTEHCWGGIAEQVFFCPKKKKELERWVKPFAEARS